MPDGLDWWGYALFAALPLAGFVLGLVWTRRQFLAGRDPLRPPPTPQLPVPTHDSRVVEALETLQGQLSELAERQDFTERLLATRRQEEAPRRPPVEPRIPTPV
jgi:hypothetical protein